MTFEEPSVSVQKKSNEENISAIKSWSGQLSDNLNYLTAMVEQLTIRVSKLEAKESE